MSQFVFFYLAGVIVVTALLVVLLKNPIYSALSLLILFFHVAGLYVTLHAEFLAAVQVIVYAGAILVLYLFVVMLLNVKRDERYHSQGPLAALLGLTIVTEALLVIAGPRFAGVDATVLTTELEGNTEAVGELLFSQYLYPFEIASLLLLVAMVGAIILAKRDLIVAPPGRSDQETLPG
jgi:NADH-quinone oxidoreductase subunit J